MWNYKYSKDKKESEFNVLTVNIIKKCCVGITTSMEIGAGTGQLSYLLKKIYPELFPYMIDISNSAIKYILNYFNDKGLTSDVDFYAGDIDIFDISPLIRDFTLCFSSGLIEHYKDGKQVGLVKIHKELSEKYVVCIVPYANEENIKFSKSAYCINHYGYEKPLTEDELDKLFIDKDFKKIHSELYYKNDKLLIGIYERIE